MAAATLAAAASCSINNLGEVTGAEGPVVLTAGTETPVPVGDTRTVLAADTATVLWSANDAFALLGNDGSKSKFTLTSGAQKTVGSFAGTPTGAAPWYAIYPYDESVTRLPGELHFKLAAVQNYTSGTFSKGANPSIAKTASLDDPLQFKNLCGVLCLKLTGTSTLSRLVLHDLGGNLLWGDCTVALDGKEGTAEQTMTLSGGDNTLTLNLGSVALSLSTPQAFFFVVPAGALDRGFIVKAFDKNDNLCGVVQTQVANTPGRSEMVRMPAVATKFVSESADPLQRGYYKDLFMDGGIGLTSRTTLPAASYLNLDWEFYASLATGKTTAQDTLIQTEVFIGSDTDLNGALLYPDGEPRFRCIYVNGGKSTQHGASLGETGRNRIRAYYANGGAYVGTCAGCLISSKGYDSQATTTTYFGIWPGHTYHTKTDSGKSVTDTYTSMTIEPGCALLNYYDYGGDLQINGVRHNGGCYMSQIDYPVPAGTEILLRYLTPGPDSTKLNGSVSGWAYKATEESGRLCVIGSHPEGVSSGEQRDLFSAMIRYACDGNGCVTPKGTLSKGVAREMTRKTTDNQPANTRIGDKQYHHFNIELPADVDDFTLTLAGIGTSYDLYVGLARERTAWLGDSDYLLCTSGPTKSLRVKHLPAGKWSVCVYCPVTVTSTKTQYTSGAYYYQYSGETAVLNGVPYRIMASWNATGPNTGTGGNQPATPIPGTWD